MPLSPETLKTGARSWYDFFSSLKSRRLLVMLLVNFCAVTLMWTNASDPSGSSYALIFWTLVLGMGPISCVYLWTQAMVDVAQGTVEAPEDPGAPPAP